MPMQKTYAPDKKVLISAYIPYKWYEKLVERAELESSLPSRLASRYVLEALQDSEPPPAPKEYKPGQFRPKSYTVHMVDEAEPEPSGEIEANDEDTDPFTAVTNRAKAEKDQRSE